MPPPGPWNVGRIEIYLLPSYSLWKMVAPKKGRQLTAPSTHWHIIVYKTLTLHVILENS